MPDAQGNPLPNEPGYTPVQPGLINAAPVGTTAAATATPTTATPFTVAPNATVASNVEGIIAKDSPLMQQAASRAAQQVNARGLLNSSIGISAGQSALYDAALPIAQQDAATYDRAATNTAQAKNTAGLLDAQLKTGVSQSNTAAVNTAGLQVTQVKGQKELQVLQNDANITLADKQAATSKYIANLQADTTLTAQEKQSQTQVAMQGFQLYADKEKIALDGTIRDSLARTEAGYKTLMQTSAGAADLYKQSIANFAAIIANKDITDKTAALNLGVQQLSDALKLIGDINNMDLGSYLTFA